jgi:hypothetical protein
MLVAYAYREVANRCYADYRSDSNVWGFERLGDTVVGHKKHLIYTVLGAALLVLCWCFNLGAMPTMPDL